MIPGIAPVIAGGAMPELTWLGAAQHSGSTSTTVSFGDIIVASPGLVIVVALMYGSSSGTVSNISIGGTAASLVSGFASNSIKRGIGYLERPAGTHNVTVNLTAQGSNVRNVMGAWLLSGYKSTTPVDSGTSSISSATSKSLALDIPAGGVAVYGYHKASTNTQNWTGGDIVKRAEETVSSARTVSFADKQTKAVLPGDTVTATSTGSDEGVLIGASWR